MKLSVKIILVVLILAGAVCMVSNYNGSGNFKYAVYISKDPQLGITMEYLSGWTHQEQRGTGNKYAQVLFAQPTEEEGFKAHMVIKVQHSSKATFTPLNIEGMKQDLLTKRQKLKEAQILSQSKMSLLGQEAIDIELYYKSLDKLYHIDAKLIALKERIVIFEKDDKFYTLRYLNREEEFENYDEAFDHCIKTLKIKE